MENLKQLFSAGKPLPALILLFGIILTTSGFYNAISTAESHTLSGNVILTYPKLHVGVLMSTIGFIMAIGGYLLLHGRLRLQRYGKKRIWCVINILGSH